MAPQVLTQQIDAATWQALGLVLTVAGLMVSVVVWRRSGAGRGLHAVAWSLVPLAAGLTGVLRLAWEILDSTLRWGARLVFSPVVWLGIVVAVVALALHVTGTLLLRRGAGRVGGAERRAVGTGNDLDGAPPASGRSGGKSSGRRSGQVVDDQDDIEAILRKHGIS